MGAATSGGNGATGGAGSGAVSSGGHGTTGGAGAPTVNVDPNANGLIALGSTHTCVVVSRRVYCWGESLYGQTGERPSDPGTPVGILVPLEEEMAGVVVSDNHTCAWARSGAVYCWGADDAGQLGVDSQHGGCVVDPCEYVPQQVPGIRTAVEVAVTTKRSCARLADGSVRCWGDVAGSISAWADGVTNATSITLAPAGACATTTAGTVSCSFALSADVAALQGARRVALSGGAMDARTFGFGCVVGTDDSVTCFGDDTYGQRGDGEVNPSELKPALASGVASISVGYDHACALDSSGQLQCWGGNINGAVAGYPLTSPNCEDKTCERAPRPVLGVPTLAAVSAYWATCGLATDNTVWCWGGTDQAYVAGAPLRVVGPWETGGDACVTALGSLTNRREFEYERGCNTDADCVQTPLDLSCDHTCAIAGIGQQHLASARAALATMETDECAPAAAAGCAAPAVSCPPLNDRAVCFDGSCTYDDPARTGCTNRCACDAERFAAYPQGQQTDCDGFDLQAKGVTCDLCEGAGVYIVVGNTGRGTFDGDVVIGFESPSVAGTPLPAAKTVTLHLASGERSAPIHFASDSTVGAAVRVTAAGDCEPDNDGSFYVAFPGPAQACPSNP